MIKILIIFLFCNLKFTLFFFKINFFKKEIIILITTIYDVACIINSFRYLFKKFFAFLKSLFFETIFDKIFIVDFVKQIFCSIFFELNLKKHYFNYFFRRDVITKIKRINFFDSLI